jgi:hypothetical protein
MMLRSAFETPRPTFTSKPGESVQIRSSTSSLSSRKILELQRRLDEPLKNTSALLPIETSGAALAPVCMNRLAENKDKRYNCLFFINMNSMVYGIEERKNVI